MAQFAPGPWNAAKTPSQAAFGINQRARSMPMYGSQQAWNPYGYPQSSGGQMTLQSQVNPEPIYSDLDTSRGMSDAMATGQSAAASAFEHLGRQGISAASPSEQYRGASSSAKSLASALGSAESIRQSDNAANVGNVLSGQVQRAKDFGEQLANYGLGVRANQDYTTSANKTLFDALLGRAGTINGLSGNDISDYGFWAGNGLQNQKTQQKSLMDQIMAVLNMRNLFNASTAGDL